MEPPKPPIEYASPRPGPQPLGRRSRRLRREAFKLLMMTGALGAAAAGFGAYGFVTVGDDASDHSPIYVSTMLVILTAVFGLFATLRYLESRSGD